jgi:hypothetical protein
MQPSGAESRVRGDRTRLARKPVPRCAYALLRARLAPIGRERGIRAAAKRDDGNGGAAGVVVGLGGASGSIDSVTELRAVIDGCPICGSAVRPTGGTHQQIAPGEGPVIESGICGFGHRVNRPRATADDWRLADSGTVWAGAVSVS